MNVITKKSEVKMRLDKCLEKYGTHGLDMCIAEFNNRILTERVKFPLLEYCGSVFHEQLLPNEHIPFCDQIQSLKTEGGNVILGIMLQKRLNDHFLESIEKATEYISAADIWYVCDIIGERVFGYSLLHYPKNTISAIEKLSTHGSNWVIRSLGAGIHYATKKGLDRSNVAIAFKMLLSMAKNRDKEIRQGIGWAAKTTAKFHPDIIHKYQNEINDTENVANWFRTKVKIGLDRNRYAQRNNR